MRLSALGSAERPRPQLVIYRDAHIVFSCPCVFKQVAVGKPHVPEKVDEDGKGASHWLMGMAHRCKQAAVDAGWLVVEVDV